MHKACKTCKKDFEVKKNDNLFYEKMKVPQPKNCPDCRMKARIAFRNERTLYRRICDLCKKEGVSIYPKDTPFSVYCHQCWWSDGWDPTVYKMDYNPSLSFFEQYKELKTKVPRVALLALQSINCDYTNNAGENKNCYLIFAAENNEDCSYSRLIMKSRHLYDCASTYESELCYECIDCKGCFKCLYSERLQNCVEVMFSFDMRNCQNCILCTNGRNLNYCIENVQYTKEEYKKRKEEILLSYNSIEKTKEKYKELKEKAILKYAVSVKCNDATGDYMYNCHHGDYLFDVRNSKDSSYVADAEDPIDCMDCNNVYYKPERCLNVMSALQCNNCISCTSIFYSNNILYSDSCYNCADCFGCAGLNKKNYHILNKEYTKEEYDKLKEEIVESMRKEGVYGDFFPPSLSPFGFNETLGIEYFPITEKEAEKQGYNWQKQTSGIYGKETIKEKDIPKTIAEVTDDILNEILVCKDCKKNFRITKSELDFYKRMNIPLPHKDFECRHQDRMKKRNPRKLWHRSCMCELKNHLHGQANCEKEFETSYSSDRPEIVYCETCYQQEVS